MGQRHGAAGQLQGELVALLQRLAVLEQQQPLRIQRILRFCASDRLAHTK
jgi:hypothetical protein